MNISRLFIFVSFCYMGVLFLVFRTWFSASPLTGGDWEYFYEASLSSFSLFPSSWNSVFGSGFGGNQTFFMVPNTFFTTTASLLSSLGFDWIAIERIVWFYPYLIISTVSSFFLFRILFGKKFKKEYAFLCSFFYLCNTYALMIVGGGQMGVGMAYALFPLVLGVFIRLSREKMSQFQLRDSLIFSLASSVLLLFDVRVFYMSWVVILIFSSFFVFPVLIKNKHFVKTGVYYYFIPIIVTLLLHSWWLFAFLLSSNNPLDTFRSEYLQTDVLSFFSFANFSDALSLLQPNWPENIFGKISFLRPEFLILPLVAFSSLMFIKKTENSYEKKLILFFVFLGILGAFLAKGVNEPFGFIYSFMFQTIPGFIMFRDPSKWYMLVALSYSALIPYSLFSVYHLKIVQKRNLFRIGYIFCIVLYFCTLLMPVFKGQLTGTFLEKQIPQEYFVLNELLANDEIFSRVFWVPSRNRYGFTSEMHPGVNASDLFQTNDQNKILQEMKKESFYTRLYNGSIGYLIVPTDPLSEIFLTDRKYDEMKRSEVVDAIEKLPYQMTKIQIGELTVYQMKNTKPLFTDESGGKINFQRKSPSHYILSSMEGGETIEFSNAYDPDWLAKDRATVVMSKKHNGFNTFYFANPSGNIIVQYKLQQMVIVGLILSGVVLVGVIGSLVYISKAN